MLSEFLNDIQIKKIKNKLTNDQVKYFVSYILFKFSLEVKLVLIMKDLKSAKEIEFV